VAPLFTTLLQDMPHTYARRGAPPAPLSLDAALDGFCWVGRYLASAMIRKRRDGDPAPRGYLSSYRGAVGGSRCGRVSPPSGMV